MNDKRVIVIGLVILLLIIISPILYTVAVGGSEPRPELELPAGESQCIEDKDHMTAHHMDLLNEWRDAVVRKGRDVYVSRAFGVTYEMSLTGTCLNCHADRDKFCNRCHDYADVQPYCWDCHVEPKAVHDG